MTITYLTEDPGAHDAAWIAAHGVSCPAPATGTPRYAYVVSLGRDTVGGHRRTLFGTYAFKTRMKGNMPGGHLGVWKTVSAVNDLCMDAGAVPAPGGEVRMQPCLTLPDGSAVDQQKFGYQPDLTLTLVTADTTLYPDGLCLEAGSAPTVTDPVRFQECGSKTTLERQQWSFNATSGFFGTKDKKMTKLCFSVENVDTPGSRVVLNDTSGGLGPPNPACNKNYPNGVQSWVLSPEAGAGASALPSTEQLVNFGQFGRCLDLPERVTVPYEIVFQCKQNPDPNVRDWNQQWDLPDEGLGTIFVQKPDGTTPGGDYCLTAPAVGASPPVVAVTLCPLGAAPDSMTWWVRGADTPTNDEAYRIEGTGVYAGYCLTPLPEEPAFQQADKAGIKPCSGDHLQKWNAEPGSTGSGFLNVGER